MILQVTVTIVVFLLEFDTFSRLFSCWIFCRHCSMLYMPCLCFYTYFYNHWLILLQHISLLVVDIIKAVTVFFWNTNASCIWCNRRCSVLGKWRICFISHKSRTSGQRYHNAHLVQAFLPLKYSRLSMLEKDCFFGRPTRYCISTCCFSLLPHLFYLLLKHQIQQRWILRLLLCCLTIWLELVHRTNFQNAADNFDTLVTLAQSETTL